MSRLLGTLFCTLLLAGGSWALIELGQGATRLVASRSWPEAPCVVEVAEVEEHLDASERPGDDRFRLHVEFRYRFEGIDYRSDRYQSRELWSDDYAELARIRRDLTAAPQSHCYVNPEEPAAAVLRLVSCTWLAWLLLPLVSIAAGGAGLYLIWRPRPATSEPRIESISDQHVSTTKAIGCGALFFAVFLVAGLAFLVPFFALPAYHTWSSGNWTQLPATIEDIGVRTHSSDDGGPTYSVRVLFSYQVGSETLKSSRYSFFGGSDSDYTSKREAVDALPAGSRTTCWVDPDDSLNAVLSRSFPTMLWIALIPLLFVAVGAGGILFVVRGGGRKRSQPSPDGFSGPQVSSSPGTLTLRPTFSPLGKLVGILLVALFWNGITGAFVYHVVRGWQEGSGEGCLTLILVPFVLVGVLLLVSIPYRFLALFNPRPVLTLTPGLLRTGESVDLAWTFEGASGRLQGLTLTLKGEERATYRRGTDTQTATHIFLEQELVRLTSGQPLDHGHAGLELAADTMHSFDSGHNKVVWKLELAAPIRFWPDVAAEFELQVEPGEARS